MRWRLILAFLAVILVTLLSLTFWIQNNTFNVVDEFFRRGENYGAETVVEDLEAHYAQYGSWDNAEELIELEFKGPGSGTQTNTGQSHNSQFQNRPQMSLADPEGNIIFGRGFEDYTDKLGEDILNYSIPLRSDDEIVGYLIPNDIVFLTNINFSKTLSSSITTAAYKSILIAGGVSVVLAFVLG